MFQISKKKKFPSANSAASSMKVSADEVAESKVASANKVNPGEFSAIANLKSLKKKAPSADMMEPKGFKGTESVKEEKLETINSAYAERVKKRANKK